MFTLYSPKAKLAQKITVVQNKKNFTGLIKDRLLAFEPPSTVQNRVVKLAKKVTDCQKKPAYTGLILHLCSTYTFLY